MNKRVLENYHVLLWLLKDMCWAMEFKFWGTLMIIPAIGAALWMLFLSRGRDEFSINLAVLFWIIANSLWMTMDFFHFGKNYYCLPLFIAGLFAFGSYSFSRYIKNSND